MVKGWSSSSWVHSFPFFFDQSIQNCSLFITAAFVFVSLLVLVAIVQNLLWLKEELQKESLLYTIPT